MRFIRKITKERVHVALGTMLTGKYDHISCQCILELCRTQYGGNCCRL